MMNTATMTTNSVVRTATKAPLLIPIQSSFSGDRDVACISDERIGLVYERGQLLIQATVGGSDARKIEAELKRRGHNPLVQIPERARPWSGFHIGPGPRRRCGQDPMGGRC